MISALMRTLLAGARNSVARRGWIGTLKLAPHKTLSLLGEWTFDWRYGLDTTTLVGIEELDVRSAKTRHAHGYEAAQVFIFREMMAALPVPLQDFVFIDFGSGKGRTLLLATHYPFKKIIGVEWSAQLNEVASRNLQRYRTRRRKCRQVETVCADASTYPLPADHPLICFFYNPFKESLLAQTMANIGSSLSAAPRDLFVLYLNPENAQVTDRCAFLKRMLTTQYYIIYRNQGGVVAG